MKFNVKYCKINYGFAIIEADSKEEVENKAMEVYNAGNVHWVDSEVTDICAEIETPGQLYVGDLVETSRNALITGIGEITGIASDDHPGTTEHFIVNFGDCIGTCTVHARDMKKYVPRKQREVSVYDPKADVAPITNPDYWDCYCDGKLRKAAMA